MAGIRYKDMIFSGAAAFGTADHVAYDNTESGLSATDVQGAVDEICPINRRITVDAQTPAELYSIVRDRKNVYINTTANGTKLLSKNNANLIGAGYMVYNDTFVSGYVIYELVVTGAGAIIIGRISSGGTIEYVYKLSGTSI